VLSQESSQFCRVHLTSRVHNRENRQSGTSTEISVKFCKNNSMGLQPMSRVFVIATKKREFSACIRNGSSRSGVRRDRCPAKASRDRVIQRTMVCCRVIGDILHSLVWEKRNSELVCGSAVSSTVSSTFIIISYFINCLFSRQYGAATMSSCCLLTLSTNVGSSNWTREVLWPLFDPVLDSLYANSITPATKACDLISPTKGAHNPDSPNIQQA